MGKIRRYIPRLTLFLFCMVIALVVFQVDTYAKTVKLTKADENGNGYFIIDFNNTNDVAEYFGKVKILLDSQSVFDKPELLF